MNKQIHVRDFKGTAYVKLVKRAKSEGLSLSQYLRKELELLAEKPTFSEVMAELDKNPPIEITTQNILSAIHEDREMRIDQILASAGFGKESGA